ncbi:MerR family transcriptional regulator [Amylibacter sp. SFDW26]|uniref:MerR family transcriptional regulator n=1 Tax=Amylibacter sp. SFDW26 TaxID=2652722 RepID=UPI001262A34B|nr:MerR family transcriptional regulator [Amylibacter sp. SFDW26]KAB7616218.1 MerR family transcriptional regulator [Amylibacter sp. SFDW26]
MRISEAASRSGLSIDTIRYYEKSGLVPAIERSSDGVRQFSPENVEWLTLLASLRETGMPMKKMQYFAELYAKGDTTVSEREQVLLEHSDHLEERRKTLERCADLLRYKLTCYAKIKGVPE